MMRWSRLFGLLSFAAMLAVAGVALAQDVPAAALAPPLVAPAATAPGWLSALSNIALQLLGLASPILIPAMILLGKKLHDFIAAKVTNTYEQGALLRLNDSVVVAVKEVEQTLGDSSKTPAEKKQAALDAIKSHWGERGLAEVAGVLGLDSLESLLSSKVEAAVHDVNAGQAATAALAGAANPPAPPQA